MAQACPLAVLLVILRGAKRPKNLNFGPLEALELGLLLRQ